MYSTSVFRFLESIELYYPFFTIHSPNMSCHFHRQGHHFQNGAILSILPLPILSANVCLKLHLPILQASCVFYFISHFT